MMIHSTGLLKHNFLAKLIANFKPKMSYIPNRTIYFWKEKMIKNSLKIYL